MREKILSAVEAGCEALRQLTTPHALTFIEEGAEQISCCFQRGGKLLIAGNGGSLCDAAHFAEELTGFFRTRRRALPAIALCEPGHLTCVGNDVGFDQIFARGVEAYGREEDLFIGLTTSGNSRNLILAFAQAKQQGLATMAFLGRDGGLLKGEADLQLIIEGFSSSDRIQEAHMVAIHILIELVEERLFGSSLNSLEKTPLHAGRL